MKKFGKLRDNSGMTSTHKAENIFPKYLLYYVHEIARKYLKEKYRYSSFSDSELLRIVVLSQLFFQQKSSKLSVSKN